MQTKVSRLRPTYFHVDCQLKLQLDDLDQFGLGDGAFTVSLSTEGHEGIQVLIDIDLIVNAHLLLLVPIDSHDECARIQLGHILLVKELVDLLHEVLLHFVTACYKEK